MNIYSAQLKNAGIVIVNKNEIPLTQEEWDYIINLSDTIEYEKVILSDVGDKHMVYVGRLSYDQQNGYASQTLHEKESSLCNILLSNKLKAFYKKIIGYDNFVIPRCQYNILKEGGFLGRHVDNVTNPHYYVSIVIHLPSDYSGGEFVYEFNGTTVYCKPIPYSMVLTRSIGMPHEVTQITRGLRKVLVYFLSFPYLKNE